jgi:guanylate kinase
LYINPPSLKVLEDRLRGRGTETNEEVERRMSNVKKEMEGVRKLRLYEHFTNDGLEESKHWLIQFINKQYGLNLEP